MEHVTVISGTLNMGTGDKLDESKTMALSTGSVAIMPWGEALDCFWVVDGKAEWSTPKLVDGVNGYRLLADEAEAAGLTAGGHWKRFKDWLHVQLRAASDVSTVTSVLDIDAAMRARFGG